MNAALESKLVTLGALVVGLGALFVIWRWFPGNEGAMGLVATLVAVVTASTRGLLGKAAKMLILGYFCASASACTPGARQAALDVGMGTLDAACVLVKSDTVTNETDIAKACGVVSDFEKYLPFVRDLIAAKHKAKAMRKAAAAPGAPETCP